MLIFRKDKKVDSVLNETKYIMKKYSISANKSLGQNFLIDDSIVDNIANAIDYKENNMVIEIGPGSGNLTKKLLKKADFVLLYEIDTRLKKILSRELLEFNNYDIIWDDFLYRDVKEDLKKYNYKNIYIVANLPYYITTPIVSKFVMETIPANEIVIMIQKEVAERISASHGNKTYGILSVFLQTFYDIEYLFTVGEQVFDPPPKVKSAVIRLTRNKREKLDCDEKLFFQYRKIRFQSTTKNPTKLFKINYSSGFCLRNIIFASGTIECRRFHYTM